MSCFLSDSFKRDERIAQIRAISQLENPRRKSREAFKTLLDKLLLIGDVFRREDCL